MEARGWIMLRVLMNRYNPQTGNALLKLLPAEDLKAVMSQDIRSTDLTPLMLQPQKILTNMHYSWLKPLIDQFPSNLHPLFLGALTPVQSLYLQKKMEIKSTSLSEPVKNFILHQVYALLKDPQPLPIEYLPETELSPLAKWSKKDLVMLIDFLGLYDLAPEIRSIVNKRYLENIYSCLSSKQLYYLKICLYQKDKLVIPKLGINPAEKNCERLKSLLHQRGLIRLGKALCGQHPDLMWYVTHTLDIGRGTILARYYQAQMLTNITTILKLQVVNVMNFIKKSKL
jgi:hypothetical protein